MSKLFSLFAPSVDRIVAHFGNAVIARLQSVQKWHVAQALAHAKQIAASTEAKAKHEAEAVRAFGLVTKLGELLK